jgi:hypothetical protein
MDYALIRAAAEMEFRVAKFLNERTVDQCIDIREKLAQALVRNNLFICKSCIAPDVLAGLLLDAACEFSKRFNLVERIASRECDIGKLICLHNLQKFIDGNFPAAIEIPRLRVVTAMAMVTTSRTIY